MSSKLSIGSVVYGSSGIGCRVLSIEGDLLAIDTTSGVRQLQLSKVMRSEPPTLPAGQRVVFTGDSTLYPELLEGEVLTVVIDLGEWVKVRTPKNKPVSIPRADLRALDTPISPPVESPPSEPSDLKVGDRVRYVGKAKHRKREYFGVLTVSECLLGTYRCTLPDGSLTTWLTLDALEILPF